MVRLNFVLQLLIKTPRTRTRRIFRLETLSAQRLIYPLYITYGIIKLQCHIFEELLLVAKGTGYDVHEGTRYPWEAGDLICIPPMTAHSHHNEDKGIARLISTWPRYPAEEYFGGIEQISTASRWKK